MKDIIRGFKSLGIIGGLLLQGALESMANTYEENREEYQSYKEESLEDQWKRELYYYSDERLDEELRRCLKTLKEEELMIMNWIASGRKMIDLSRETGINKDKLQRQKKNILNKLKKSLTLSV